MRGMNEKKKKKKIAIGIWSGGYLKKHVSLLWFIKKTDGNDNKSCICYNETMVCYSNKTLTLMQEIQLLTEHSLDLFEIIL